MRARAACLALTLAACGGEAQRPLEPAVSAGPLRVEIEPLARFTRGDPVAIALAPDGERLWRVDGARASEWRIEGARLERLREFDVVGPVLALAEAGERLVLACGERGLLVAERGEPEPRLRSLWRQEGRWCTDVELRDGRLWSTFAAVDDSRLVVLDADSLVHEAEFELGRGVAWAVAARGERAWIALGEGGLARADLARGTLEPGPMPGDGPWRVVRDVALTDTHLAAACDGLGVALVALDASWGARTPLERLELELEGRPTYAVRVSADGPRLAVGTNLAPVAAQEGAPYGLAGWIDGHLRVGGVDPKSYDAGSGQGWFLFERSDGAWLERARASGRGGWRTLELSGEHSFEQHIGAGLVVRRAADGAELLRDAPEGLAVLAAELALDDPDLLLATNDPAGSRPGGWPRLAHGRIDFADDTRDLEPLGLLAGPQWRDDAGRTWCLFGTPLDWNLWLVDAAAPRASRRWSVAPPLDADGERGASYFSAALAGDLLVLARARSHEGLLTASASSLVERALAAPDGARLELPVRAVLRTHAESPLAATFTWEPALDPARGLALVPCGFGDDGRARWLVVDVAAEPPLVMAEVAGALSPGHAVACALDGTRAMLVDLMGDVLALDLTDPRNPRRTGRWSAPTDTIDGRRPNLLDVALVPNADGSLRAWIAAGRAGLVHLTLDPDGALTFERRLPTDGWAASVRPSPGGHLVVGDQKGGARVYAH